MTTLTPRQEAEQEQGRASDPAASAWVTASAGSGKTKVLTDRVLRLLLHEHARPDSILCLTFTKAAAAEMRTRLAARLGAWAVMPESRLAQSLADLLGAAPDRATIGRARGLFAKILDLPGGMRISTIHAFCQSLLRAFPLEAGLSPQFALIEDTEADALLAESQEAVLAGAAPREALEALAGLVPPNAFRDLVKALTRDRARLAAALEKHGSPAALEAAIAARLGLEPDADEHALLHAACAAADDAALIAAARLQAASRNAKDQDRAASLLAWLALDEARRAARWDDWRKLFLTQKDTVLVNLGTQQIGPRQAESVAILKREAERVLEAEENRRACRLLAATRALLGLGRPVLDAYAARKQARGLMDYEDLILGARRLLDDPGSAWVLYKMDGGLDHLLLDEAQDSNQHQWEIARALTGDFFTGQGAAAAPRSIFAVGDVKQSIYGFQGADPTGFTTSQQAFARAAKEARSAFRDVTLKVSFRSTAPILALVDAVFREGPARAGVVEQGAALEHRADRVGEAGRVELWPMLEPAATADPEPWEVPESPTRQASGGALLAEAVAARIATWLERGELLPSRGRAMRPGDILVLVRKRTGTLVPRLLRALKERGVPVGGADRLRLIEQIAVQDLLALADVLLLPEDDLQLAAVLKSPLIGFSDDQLLDLAAERQGSLWARLAQERGRDTPEGRAADGLARLMNRADLVTPHALLAEILGEHGGRARLLARLGPDAADPLDELLNAALDHERRHPPSLQHFVQWLRRGGAEIKREQAEGGAVRVMTAHNAKGLQAPVVILPDTVSTAPRDSGIRWDASGLPFWAPRKDAHAAAFADLLAAEKARRAEEENRLLYVALTRAEDRLLVCGWQRKPPRGAPWPAESWYGLVEQGFRRLGASETAFDPAVFGAPGEAQFGPVLLSHGNEQTAALRQDRAESVRAAPPLPVWARHPAPPEQGLDALAPSAVPAEDETPAAPPHGAADPTGQRFRRGRLVHALLQHLPEHPPERRESAARAFLARPGHGLDAAEQAATLAEVMALLAEPSLAAALAPGSLAEAPIVGRLGDRLVSGQVDRFLVTPDRVLVLDYKTNRPPPARVEQVPALYLRQMAAYRAVLRLAFPGRRVECALVWTYGARFMLLPDGYLDTHAPGA